MAGIDAYTKLLLHCNGADQATAFPDASGNSNDATAHNQAQVDTAQKKFGTGSALFDGTTDWLSCATDADWDFGAGDFTLDFWVRFNSVATTTFICRWGGAADAHGWSLHYGSDLLNFSYTTDGTTETKESVAWTPSADTWYHIAVVRNGNNLYFFVDGVQTGATKDMTGVTIYDVSTITLQVAGYGENGSGSLNGWEDEIRVSKGIARWTANFTPPTEEYGVSDDFAGYLEV